MLEDGHFLPIQNIIVVVALAVIAQTLFRNVLSQGAAGGIMTNKKGGVIVLKRDVRQSGCWWIV